MKVTVVKAAGGTGEIEVADATFAVPYKQHLIHQIVVAYQAGGRVRAHRRIARR